MDLSLRSYVGGWKAIFLEDTTCLNELPASFFAYRKQQHRWTCGPVQLWRKTAYYIWHSNLPFHRKVCPLRRIHVASFEKSLALQVLQGMHIPARNRQQAM